MKRWLGPLLLGIVLAATVHAAMVYAIPRLLIHAAMDGIRQHGGVNAWIASRHRVDPTTRGVVRPAPQLAYAACVYALDDGAVHIRVAPMPGYWSLSLYNARSDNYRTWSDRTSPDGVDIWLSDGDAPRYRPSSGVTVVHSPSSGGIALIRRRVTGDSEWARLQNTRRGDLCKSAY